MYSILFFIFIPLLAFILLAVNLIFAPHNPYQEKDNVFECGYTSFGGQNRTQFSISFFIFALLFLLFDLEILLVYPYIVSGYNNGIYGLGIMLLFILILTLGFAFELGKKALNIESRQVVVTTNKEDNSIIMEHNVINIDTTTDSTVYCTEKNSDNSKNIFRNFIAKVFTLRNFIKIFLIFSCSLLLRKFFVDIVDISISQESESMTTTIGISIPIYSMMSIVVITILTDGWFDYYESIIKFLGRGLSYIINIILPNSSTIQYNAGGNTPDGIYTTHNTRGMKVNRPVVIEGNPYNSNNTGGYSNSNTNPNPNINPNGNPNPSNTTRRQAQAQPWSFSHVHENRMRDAIEVENRMRNAQQHLNRMSNTANVNRMSNTANAQGSKMSINSILNPSSPSSTPNIDSNQNTEGYNPRKRTRNPNIDSNQNTEGYNPRKRTRNPNDVNYGNPILSNSYLTKRLELVGSNPVSTVIPLTRPLPQQAGFSPYQNPYPAASPASVSTGNRYIFGSNHPLPNLPALGEYGNYPTNPTYNNRKNYSPAHYANEFIQTSAYTKIQGRYYINDPTNIATRGYINPHTRNPYLTYQPFAKNLAEAMLDELKCEEKPLDSSIKWRGNNYNTEARLFLEEVLRERGRYNSVATYRNAPKWRTFLNDLD